MPSENDTSVQNGESTGAEFTVKKLSSFFVDEVANISIAPNGACRIQFVTWGSDSQGQAERVDSEVILTIQTLKSLSDALPKAIDQSEKLMAQRLAQPEIKGTVQ